METPEPCASNQPRFTSSERINPIVRDGATTSCAKPAGFSRKYRYRYEFITRRSKTRTRTDLSCDLLHDGHVSLGRLRTCPARTGRRSGTAPPCSESGNDTQEFGGRRLSHW